MVIAPTAQLTNLCCDCMLLCCPGRNTHTGLTSVQHACIKGLLGASNSPKNPGILMLLAIHALLPSLKGDQQSSLALLPVQAALHSPCQPVHVCVTLQVVTSNIAISVTCCVMLVRVVMLCLPLLQLVEADNAWLKRSESHHRAIKMSLVQQHCPGLIRQFEQQQRGKAEKKTQAGRKQAASKVSTHATAKSLSFVGMKQLIAA